MDSSPNNSRSLSLDMLHVSDTFCFLTSMHVLDFYKLFFTKARANIALLFIGNTRVIPFASFSAFRTVVMGIKHEAKMSAFGSSGLSRTHLVGGHFYSNISEQYAQETHNNEI